VLNTGATFTYAPPAAAGYLYDSTPDPGMTGIVRVPMHVKPTTGDINTIFKFTWAIAPQPDIAFDVQGHNPGHHWDGFYIGLDPVLRAHVPAGTWDFKVRLVDVNSFETTAWSPMLRLVVSN
jgi:hypothetical protein